ncbi:hypothetical protein TKK_0018629 [Trichogramma kaykai]
MKALGHGLTAIQTLFRLLDLSKAMEQYTYDAVVSTIRSAAESVTKESICSMLTFLLISNETGKVLDVITKNTYCKADLGKKDKESCEYEEWFKERKNKCTINHVGSLGLMEVNGIVEMFQRAEAKLKVRYKNDIGYGDCKVHKKISVVKKFGNNYTVEKKKNINHVGKRMGTHFENRKKQLGKNYLQTIKSLVQKDV